MENNRANSPWRRKLLIPPPVKMLLPMFITDSNLSSSQSPGSEPQMRTPGLPNTQRGPLSVLFAVQWLEPPLIGECSGPVKNRIGFVLSQSFLLALFLMSASLYCCIILSQSFLLACCFSNAYIFVLLHYIGALWHLYSFIFFIINI